MLAESLAAAGIVEPSSEIIRIGTEISGTVERVLVTPGDRVNRGDPLFVLDSRIVQAELLQRRSDLMAAEARLAQARARIPGLAAEVEVARRVVLAVQADNDEARDIVRIADRLQLGDTISERELTRRKNLLRGADARLGEAQARLAQAEANLALLNEAQGGASIAVELAAVSQAMAAVKSAETNLDVRTVRATIDGTVLQVNVRPGEFAQADWGSQALVTLGATNLLHIRVDIDEVDAPRWRQDAAATAVQRGAPLNAMRLTFVRREPLVVPKRALSGLSAERVDTRVMQVIYAIDTAGATILPGQQLDVLIEASKSDVQASIGQ
jgi:multidrug resistance efflux pump